MGKTEHNWVLEDKPSICTDCHKPNRKWCSKCEACGLCGLKTKCNTQSTFPNPTMDDSDKHSTMRREQQKVVDWINCCTEGDTEKIEKLLKLYMKTKEAKSEEDFIMNIRDGNGRCALHFIVQADKLAAARFIVHRAPKSVNLQDDNGLTPIFLVFNNQNSELFRYLIKHNADIKIHDKINNSSLLHYACSSDKLEIVKYLIEEKKFDCNENSLIGSPLHFALESNQYEIAKYLLSIPVNVNLKDNNKCTPIIFACVSGNLKEIELLLNSKPDLTLCLDDNVTPLHILCDACNIEGIKLFLNQSNIKELCNIETLEHKLKPIHFAAGRKNKEIMKLLLPYSELNNKIEGKEEEELFNELIDEQVKMGIWNEEKIEKQKPHVLSEDENKAEDIKKQGNIAFVKKDYETSIKLYTEAIQYNPYSEILFANRALAYRLIKKYDEALSDIEESIKLNPKWAKSHYRKGEIYMDKKDYVNAAQSFFDATQYEPDNADILKKLKLAIDTGKKQNQIQQ